MAEFARPVAPRMKSTASKSSMRSNSEAPYASEPPAVASPLPSPSLQQQQQQHSGTVTPSSALARLEELLVAKSEEIQMAGRLGERLLSQQSELEQKIADLEGLLPGQDSDSESGVLSSHNEQVAEQVRSRFEALETEMQTWESGNEELYQSLAKPQAYAEQPDVHKQTLIVHQSVTKSKKSFLCRTHSENNNPAAGQELPKTRARMIWSLLQKSDSRFWWKCDVCKHFCRNATRSLPT